MNVLFTLEEFLYCMNWLQAYAVRTCCETALYFIVVGADV